MRAKHTEGFTVAELLTVVAILAVLMAIVGVSLVNYLRNFTLTEYDNAAKSLYIAAQNNLADLQASGEWDANKDGKFTGKGVVAGQKATEPTAQRTDDNGETQSDGLHYYYVTAEFARESGILPQGTIDADVWSHSFIIEYCYETTTVYGVFYTEDPQGTLDGFYATGMDGGADIRSAAERKKTSNPIIGYYGGATARSLEHVELEAPSITVTNGHILVTDPNLDKNQKRINWNTFQVLTIKGENETLMLRLSSLPFEVDVYREEGSSFVKVNLAANAPDDFCELIADPLQEGSLSKNTYSIDIAALQAAVENVVGQEPLKYAENEVVDIKSKCSSNKVLCRSVYGYAQGMWAAASEDLIFTSNIIADWQTEATIDAYVTNDGNKVSDQQGNGKGYDVEITLSNFYDDDTWSVNPLCYSVFVSGGGLFEPNVVVHEKSKGQGNVVGKPTGYYLFENTKKTHYVTLTLNELDIAKAVGDLTYTVRFTAHKVDANGAVSSPVKTLTVTINVHKSDYANYYYVTDSPGSLYAELTMLIGAPSSPQITWSAGVSIDASSPLVGGVQATKSYQITNQLAEQGSYSIKFLKSDSSADYSKEKTPFGYDPSGITAYEGVG